MSSGDGRPARLGPAASISDGDVAVVDFARDLARVERLAQLLDARFHVAGISFGWDAIIGLVPVVGDIATAAMALYPIYLARRHKLGRWLIARMLANVAVDAAVGAVPVLGDIFDVAWKANYRNLSLFRKAAANPWNRFEPTTT